MKNIHTIEKKLDQKEWEKILDDTFKAKQKDIKIDGFRKGAVTKEVYIKKFGLESLYMDAADKAISKAYKEVLTDEKLIPVIEPKIDIKDISEKGITFEIVITTKPEVKLGAYKDLKIKKEQAKVTKEEITAEIENLVSKMAELVIKEKGTVENGNIAVIDFKGVVDGKVIEGGVGEAYPLEIGSNSFIPGFEEKVVGMKKDESKDLELTFPENYTEELKGKNVTFTVTVKEIKERKLPELTKELYEDLGYENVETEEDFRTEIEKNLIAKKENTLEDEYIEACLSKAADNMKVEISDEITDEEVHRMMHQYEDQLKMQGLSLDKYYEFTGTTHDDLHKQMAPEASKRVKYRYLIEAVADAEDIKVTDKEAEEEAEKSSAMYGVSKDEFIKMIGGLEMLKYDTKMRRAIEIIKG